MTQTIFQQNDVLWTISRYLDPIDIQHLSLTSKLLYQRLKAVHVHYLFVCPGNLTCRHHTQEVTTLFIKGDFNKKERMQLSSILSTCQPQHLILDSNCADFPSFYANPSFFDLINTLSCHNGCVEFIEIERFHQLNTLILHHHDTQYTHMVAKDMPHVHSLELHDCDCSPSESISDYAFAGPLAPSPEEMSQTLKMPYLTHFRSYSTSCLEETLSLNIMLLEQVHLFMPLLQVADIKNEDRGLVKFGFIKKLEHLRYFGYACHTFNTAVFPFDSTLAHLVIQAKSIVVSEVSTVRINRIQLETIHLDYTANSLLSSRDLVIKAMQPRVDIRRTNDILYAKIGRWKPCTNEEAMRLMTVLQ